MMSPDQGSELDLTGEGDAEQAPPHAADVIEIDEILRLIPHRFPFVFVDRCMEYRPSESIRGVKAVTFNESFFQGHFPGFAVMPGVLQVEALAQTGAVLMSKSLDVDVTRNSVFFMSVDDVKFRSPVRPGDLLEMEVKVLLARRSVFKFQGVARVKDRLTAEAVFAAKVVSTAQ